MLRTALIGTASLTLVAGVGLASYTLGANQAPRVTQIAQPEDEMDMDAMMQMMMQAAAPGEKHKELAKSVGTWQSDMTFGGGFAGTGTMEVKPLLDGRFTHSSLTGTFNGGPFAGHAIMGYDNVRKEYVSIWIDNWGTGIMYMTGQKEGDAFVMTGKSATPMGENEMKLVSTPHGDDKTMDTFYEKHDGEWVETGNITYTRK